MSLTFVSIADDDTGASDIAGMLAAAGMSTIMVLDPATPDELRQWSRDADALVLAVATRALDPDAAYAKTRDAIELIRPLAPKVVGIKYCSTFDSTPQGNIGQSIDAAMHTLGVGFTVAVPALPVNGRTTYMGYHFVGAQLLSESSMRYHPLNPMTNANLVSHLQSQTRRRVGLVTHPAVLRGGAALAAELGNVRGSGVEIAIVDCVSDSDLETIAAAVATMPLISGSSGPAITLPAEWKRLGYWSERANSSASVHRAATSAGTLMISGSCSSATREQIAHFEESESCSFRIGALQLLSDSFDPENLVHGAVDEIQRGQNVLVRVLNDEADVHAVCQWAQASGSNSTAAGIQISRSLARIAAAILRRVTPQGVIIAGGETSSTICRALKIKALAIGPNIVPGVPLCVSLTSPEIPLVLKSGNFGGRDFFSHAIDVIHSLTAQSEAARTL